MTLWYSFGDGAEFEYSAGEQALAEALEHMGFFDNNFGSSFIYYQLR